LNYWKKLRKEEAKNYLIYGGNENLLGEKAKVVGWESLGHI
jgi:hypothetical protein